jgi:hypothetical protein
LTCWFSAAALSLACGLNLSNKKGVNPVKVNPCFYRPINCRILCRVNAAAYNATMQTHKKAYTENSQKKMVFMCMG